MPLLGDAGHQEMIDCLQKITTKINKPSVIIIISAHWEESIPTITSGLSPNLIYDYYGFPEESYNIKYPCIGKPLLAKQIQKVLGNAGIEATETPNDLFFNSQPLRTFQLGLKYNLDKRTE